MTLDASVMACQREDGVGGYPDIFKGTFYSAVGGPKKKIPVFLYTTIFFDPDEGGICQSPAHDHDPITTWRIIPVSKWFVSHI